ncbi:hypothetical protein OB13_08110 [Pontibacter sp. HJ8]
MKKLYLLLSACLLLMLTGCQRSETADEILRDEQTRGEIYTAILDDEAMQNEIMTLMRERNTSGPMMGRGAMMGDSMRMSGMNQGQIKAQMRQLLALCATDSAACNMLSQTMMQNRAMMGKMMQQMQRRGMLDSACMQQLMRQLGR